MLLWLLLLSLLLLLLILKCLNKVLEKKTKHGNTNKKGNSIQNNQFLKMAENNQKDRRRGMKERKWKNDNMEEKEKDLEGVKRRDGDNCVSVTGTLWHPWTDTACLKAVRSHSKGAVFLHVYKTYLFISSIRSFISLFISIEGALWFSVKPSTTMTTLPPRMLF